ncbi:MAG: hypothetical protein HQ464_09415 [Planctomycetes bacterium]|nr:hypothetical protein [Planctomycetota bacterium]
MPKRRIGDYSPQWLALLVEMRLITPRQARAAHLRATKQTEQESSTAPDQTRARRRRSEPE